MGKWNQNKFSQAVASPQEGGVFSMFENLEKTPENKRSGNKMSYHISFIHNY